MPVELVYSLNMTCEAFLAFLKLMLRHAREPTPCV